MEAQPKSNEDKLAKRRAFQARTAGPVIESPAPLQQLQPTKAQADLQQAAIQGGGKKEDGGGEAQTPSGAIKSEPLDAGTVRKVKDTMGADLSDVVVRTGPGADAECQKRGCSAFAVGDMITISSQAGEPGSAGYQKVLLHECAHIVQKRVGKNPDEKKAQAKPDAAQPGAAADPKAPPPATEASPEGDRGGAPEDKGPKAPGGPAAAGASTAAKEQEADQAAQAAQGGQRAQIKQAAGASEEQHAPPTAGGATSNAGRAPAAGGGTTAPGGQPQGEHNNPSQITIPIGGDRGITFTPPNRDGDWQLGVSGVKKLYAGTEKKVDKWWRKNIPTPFFGLAVSLGIQAGVTFKVGEVMLNNIVVKRRKDDRGGAWYEVEGSLETGISVEGFVALSAGVSANVWLAEAGVGVKAKLGLNASKPASASIALGYNPTTGDYGLNGKLSLAAWELALKGAVGLFAYYDAIGVSTYSKDWWLYERTLGKMTLAGVDFPFGLTRQRGFYGEVKPKPLELQGIEGNVRSAFPAHG
ncbi:MAG: DUF4157 domain-containing protein [Deltaproteobacteria bacterium]|nr:DUF4157 domain-containing protein [Deltaproteobacteria bacterium]